MKIIAKKFIGKDQTSMILICESDAGHIHIIQGHSSEITPDIKENDYYPSYQMIEKQQKLYNNRKQELFAFFDVVSVWRPKPPIIKSIPQGQTTIDELINEIEN